MSSRRCGNDRTLADANQTQLPHFDGFDSRKAAELCGPSRWRSNCGAKKLLPFWRVFYLDRLGHSVLAFRAEEGISLPWTPKIKEMPRFSLSDLFKPPYQPRKVWCLRNLRH
jgi:hypothetical protein